MRAPIVNFLTQLSIASSLLFIPLFAKELGASDLEIGLIASAYSLSTFFTSNIFGRISDFYDRKLIILSGLFLSAIFFFAQCFAKNAFQLLLVRTLLGFSIGIFPPTLISYAYSKNKNVGYFSSFGSLGWAIGQLIAGIIVFYHGIFILGSILTFLALFIILKEKIPPEKLRKSRSSFTLLKENFSIYFAFLIRHTGASAVWLIFPIYLSELGISKFWIGVIYFTNSFLQFIIMQRVDGFNPRILMSIGALSSGIAFYIYSISTLVWEFLLAQIFIAFGWSSMYVGALKMILEKNLEKSSVTGFLNSTIYLSTIFGSIIGGIIAENFSYKACLYLGAIFSFLAAFFTGKKKN
ncbi:MAG: MFS transporter [Archaeoglobaceae archaeon]|nr:MFS transporter [Archaeoglobaceae archaeon]MDW7989648.1 MFS transporter [Archaeoglobaceae archaeon]